MKKSIFLFVLALGSISVFAQSVVSSCFAPDSIRTKYKSDADQLALRKIYWQNLSYKDSVIIPKTHSDTVLNALLAVYNATALPARDTVVSMFNIHSFPNPMLNRLMVAADSTLPWMQQLKAGNIPTGNAEVDTLISKYSLIISDYYDYFNTFSWQIVVFTSDSNYNTPPLATMFQNISGVFSSEPDGVIGDGNDIQAAIYFDHVELVYSIGWGDCPSGCINRRFWKFRINFDCSVEFIGSYGSPFVITAIDKESEKPVSVFPNPFSNKIIVRGISEPLNYSLTNILGQTVLEGNSQTGTIENLNALPCNIYFLTIASSQQKITFKLLKEK